MKYSYRIALVIVAVLGLAACDDSDYKPTPINGVVGTVQAVPDVCPISKYEKNVYYFDCIGHDFGHALDEFSQEHNIISFGLDSRGRHGKAWGNFVLVRDE